MIVMTTVKVTPQFGTSIMLLEAPLTPIQASLLVLNDIEN
jgi:hypothetical protein